ncbi:MAG: hypothetical protein L0Z71_17235 [Anaerolineae bacterium]|nr:hypothetical protein [Anaerolineae bacterium]
MIYSFYSSFVFRFDTATPLSAAAQDGIIFLGNCFDHSERMPDEARIRGRAFLLGGFICKDEP